MERKGEGVRTIFGGILMRDQKGKEGGYGTGKRNRIEWKGTPRDKKKNKEGRMLVEFIGNDLC